MKPAIPMEFRSKRDKSLLDLDIHQPAGRLGSQIRMKLVSIRLSMPLTTNQEIQTNGKYSIILHRLLAR